jgi:hypothetical protein
MNRQAFSGSSSSNSKLNTHNSKLSLTRASASPS